MRLWVTSTSIPFETGDFVCAKKAVHVTMASSQATAILVWIHVGVYHM